VTVVDTVTIPAQRAPEGDTWPIVQRAQAGDSAAFGELWQLYRDRVYRFIDARVGSRQLAEDLTGDTFLRAAMSIGRWQQQGREYGAILMTIARNLVLDHFKSARGRLEVTVGDFFDLDQPDTRDPAAIVVGHFTNVELWTAVKSLSALQQEVIVLRFIHGLNVAETAAAIGRDEGAVKALLFRATRALRRKLPRGSER
jgi:RNA polymerase sigma-70 factor (ECF subfamily)